MRKTLIALGVLSAMAMSAQASDVKVYGKVDLGLSFVNIDHGKSGVDDTNQLSMASGQTAGSRVGMRGWEELGNGYRVGFILETGFSADTGSLAQNGRLFGRQSLIQIDGGFGNLKVGHMGALTSGYPDTGLFGGNMSPFAVGLGEVAGHRYLYSSEDALPMENTITYSTPKFAGGWQFIAQYSMGMDSKTQKDGVENESSIDRYMAGAVRFDNKNTEFNFVVDSTNFKSIGVSNYGKSPDNDLRVTVGVRHGLGFMTIYAGGQYFKDSRRFTQEANQFYKLSSSPVKFLGDQSFGKDGFGLNLGADYFALGGTLKGQVGYMKAENSDNSSEEMKRWFVSAGYWYDFSKRTTLYSGISYIRDSLDGDKFKDYDDAGAFTASLGIVHNF